MKKTLLMTSLFCSLLLNASYAATKPTKPAGEKLDQMVAVVNDDLITRSELDNGIKAAKMQMTRIDPNLPEKQLEQAVLQQLINKKLQMQTAEQTGLTVSDKDVDGVIARIAETNNVPVTALYDQVKKAGMTEEEYRKEIHDQVVIQKLEQHEVGGRLTVTQDEINAYMKSVKSDDNAAANEYRIHDIIVPLSDNPSTDEVAKAKARALAIKSKIESGTSCKVVTAQENKVSPLQGSDLGWMKLNEVPSAFTDDVAKMKKSALAGPIQTGNGFHVIEMEDMRKAAGNNPGAPDRKTVEAMLLQKKFESAVDTWMSKLRSTAFITTTV